MNCPKCNALMELGYIVGQRTAGVYWYPESMDRPPYVVSNGIVESVNGINLAPPTPLLKIPKAYMYICRKCRFGQFSY